MSEFGYNNVIIQDHTIHCGVKPALIYALGPWPYYSGMLPVISTRPLSNFELTLSPDGTRAGNHRCSNLLDFNEIQTGHGFITDATKNPEIIGETAPYQYSVFMRSANSLRFYRNLNLEACLWEFSSYYDMSELLNECGGSIGTDGQVRDTGAVLGTGFKGFFC